VLAITLADNAKARELLPDGSYRRIVVDNGQPLVRSQERFLELAAQSARRRLTEMPSGLVPLVEQPAAPAERRVRKRQTTS
jgi:hypothetical protein